MVLPSFMLRWNSQTLWCGHHLCWGGILKHYGAAIIYAEVEFSNIMVLPSFMLRWNSQSLWCCHHLCWGGILKHCDDTCVNGNPCNHYLCWGGILKHSGEIWGGILKHCGTVLCAHTGWSGPMKRWHLCKWKPPAAIIYAEVEFSNSVWLLYLVILAGLR
jgi:hypothetical protein